MDIGNRIKQRRINLDMTAEELAYKIGKSRATIYRYENGDIENMPTTVLEPLAQALFTTPAYLMGWDDDPEDYEALANAEGIWPPNDYKGTLEDWVKMKRATDKDVEQENGDFQKSTSQDKNPNSIDKCITDIVNNYHKLNDIGKQKAYDYITDLSGHPKYLQSGKAPSLREAPAEYLGNAANARTDIEATDEMREHDDAIMDDF